MYSLVWGVAQYDSDYWKEKEDEKRIHTRDVDMEKNVRDND